MKLFSQKAVRQFYNPPEVELLDRWLDENYDGKFKSINVPNTFVMGESHELTELSYEHSQEYIMASGLWFLKNHYPDAEEIMIFSFAYLISKYTSDLPGFSFGIDPMPGEVIGTKIILALAGGSTNDDGFEAILSTGRSQIVLKEYTRKTLTYLVEFFFESKEKAIAKMIK